MIIINPQESPEAIVIWLHGLGADGNNFVPFIKSLGIEKIEFNLPDAPIRPITLNQGMKMRGWYDIHSKDFSYQDTDGLLKSKELIEKIIKTRMAQIKKPIKIFLGGFSQGAALALFTGITSKFHIDGIVALSGYMPIIEDPKQNNNLPIIAIHGLLDDIININHAELSYQHRKKSKFFDFKKYNMGHEVIHNEIKDVNNFFLSNLHDD